MPKLLKRVPEITLLFWIVKVLSTTVGETGADFLAEDMQFGLVNTSAILTFVLMAALAVQFKLKRYVPVSYWLVILMMSVVGTLVTDLLVDQYGVSLIGLSIVFTIALTGGFILWHRSEGTLSIHSIFTGKREAYYWAIIFLAFALGTGVGDLFSEYFEIGYANSFYMFIGCSAAVAVAYFGPELDSVWAFWIAFVLTRPLGASLGDLMIQPKAEGGLGWGIAPVNIAFLSVMVACVAYMSLKKPSNDETTE